jgi:SAM-dependent methyltransferase
MSDFVCYLCGSKEGKLVMRGEGMRFKCYGHDKNVMQCSKCGLTQLYPSWKDEELEILYKGYWSVPDFKGQKRRVKVSKYLTKDIRKGDKVLEIGCGLGDNVKFLRSKGFDVIGIDKDPHICDGNYVIHCDYRNHVPEEKYDYIFGIHLLEHIQDPLAFMDQVLKMLSPGGRFLFEVPSIEEPLLTLYKNREFEKFYWYPYHVFFYTPETMTKLFSKVKGADVEIIKRLQGYGFINHSRWFLLNRPGNFNKNIPVLDLAYKAALTKLAKKSDTMIITGRKK